MLHEFHYSVHSELAGGETDAAPTTSVPQSSDICPSRCDVRSVVSPTPSLSQACAKPFVEFENHPHGRLEYILAVEAVARQSQQFLE